MMVEENKLTPEEIEEINEINAKITKIFLGPIILEHAILMILKEPYN